MSCVIGCFRLALISATGQTVGQAADAPLEDMGVDHHCPNVFVSQQFLNRPVTASVRHTDAPWQSLLAATLAAAGAAVQGVNARWPILFSTEGAPQRGLPTICPISGPPA